MAVDITAALPVVEGAMFDARRVVVSAARRNPILTAALAGAVTGGALALVASRSLRHRYEVRASRAAALRALEGLTITTTVYPDGRVVKTSAPTELITDTLKGADR
ncbi:hypothetical protein ABQE48_13100 [Mycolicibacterium thermoresistibile]